MKTTLPVLLQLILGVITDFNSLPTQIEVSPTPTLRIYNIYPKSQILGDPKSAVQTRSRVQQKSGAHALFSYIQKQQRNNHKDQQHCLFAYFLSQEEPKKIAEALQDDSWVQAMQKELLQFKLQQVWVLVDLPHGMKLVPQLVTRIDSLEKDLKQTKLTMGSAIVKLVKKVKKLEGILKRRNVVLSDSEEEEPEDQGRKSQDDPLVSLVQGLVTPSKTTVNASGEEQVEDISPTTLEAAKTLSRVASQKPKSIDKGRRYKRRKETKGKKVVTSLDFQEEVSTGYAEGVNTGSIKVSTVSGKVSTVSGQVSTDSIKKSIPSPDKGQREGKAPMIIEEAHKKTKEHILQEEATQRLAEEEELNEQQKQRRAQVQFEAQHYTDEDWDLIRAKIEANAELSKSVLGSGLQGEDFAKKMVELVNQRKKHFAEERARAKRNKPKTQSQLRTYMMNYLKNQGTWKLSQLKNLSFEEVKEEFDKLVKQVESFAPINFEATKDSLKIFGEEIQTKTSKRLKSDEAKDDEPTKKTGKRRKQMASEQDDSALGTKIPINPVAIAMKSPSIATYKIIKQGEKGMYQIVWEDGTYIVYINFGAMLKDITRDDLTELYRIVMNRYGMNRPEDELENVLWEYLKNMFEEPLSTDPIWNSLDIYMLIERQYPLSAEVCKAMLDKKLQGGKPDEDCYKLLKWIEKQAGAKGLTSPEQTATDSACNTDIQSQVSGSQVDLDFYSKLAFLKGLLNQDQGTYKWIRANRGLCFEAFTISSSEGLEKGYDRFQQLLSQLEAHGAEVSTEDANHKFLRSLPPAWSNLAMTMRTKPDVDTLSIDDFTCTPSTSSTNIPEKEVLAGFADEVIYSLFAKQSEDWDLLHEDLEQIDDLDIEEMDINWQIAMIAIRMKNVKGTPRANPVVTDDRSSECFYLQSNDIAGSNELPLYIFDLNLRSQKYFKSVLSIPILTNEKVCLAQNQKEVRMECYDERELGEGYSFTKKKCFVCGSLSHLIKDCDYYEKKMAREAEFKKQRDHPLKNMVDKGIFDSGCSGHMTGNKDQLEDFEEFNGGSVTFGEIVDFLRGSNLRYALTTNPTIYDSLVKQFWQTATANTLAYGTLELHVTIDTIVYTITKASIRNNLQLADAFRDTKLPNNEIFLRGIGIWALKSGDGINLVGKHIATALICPFHWQRFIILKTNPFDARCKLEKAKQSFDKGRNKHVTMGSAIVKLVKKGKEAGSYLKRRNVVLSYSEEGRKPEDQGREKFKRKLVSMKLCQIGYFGEEEVAKQHYTDEDWDLIRAKIEANAELSKSVLGSDLKGEDFAKKMVDLVNQRKKHFSEERARAKRNKPMTLSQLRTYMMNYLKNQGTWKLSQLKNLTTKDSLKRFGEELQTKTSKRLKSDEAKDDEPTKKTRKRRKHMARKGLHTDLDKDDSEDPDEASEQDDSASCTKIPINPVPVAMKSPTMLKDITRDDLTELYRIVMNRYGMNGPEDELEKVLWEYLKNMFEEPLRTNPIWSLLGHPWTCTFWWPKDDYSKVNGLTEEAQMETLKNLESHSEDFKLGEDC
ncbi:hypothetical protein Tco_1493301 [Tanacetum coccineum]